MAETVYIGLGSNLDHPQQQIERALDALERLPGTRLIRCSSLYGSKPQGPQDQPDFVNAVCQIETALSPMALLQALQSIEQHLGRIKKRHWGERCIDLDILLYGEHSVHGEHLTIPHPQMTQRDFVLVPLAEISPGLVIADHGSLEQLIASLPATFLKPLEMH